MQKNTVHWRAPLTATVLLVALVVAASFLVTGQVNREEEQTCFDRLSDEADKMARSIEQTVAADREKLNLLAQMMAMGFGEMEDFLSLYQDTGNFFCRLEVLLPGDWVVTTGGIAIDSTGRLSFEEESAKGAHISDRELDLDGQSLVVRHFVPVVRRGETVAMLYGVIELNHLVQELPYNPYGGQAAVYLIDGATGDFLVDTWHTDEEPGNIWALGSRPMAEGYNDAQLRQGLVDGESNFVVFVSNTTGKYLYFYYEPVNINQWRVALSVPEELVFSGARYIRTLMDRMLAAESAAFLLYLVWMIYYTRRETGEKQRQLDALNYIYRVEKLLFNAHQQHGNIVRSLEVIAQMLPARLVAFAMVDDPGQPQVYLWEQGGHTALGAALQDSVPALAASFTHGRDEVAAHTLQEVRQILPQAPDGMRDLTAIPVEDAGGALLGVLAASGLRRKDCAPLLRSVGFSYAKLCGNTRTYQAMERQGTEDALTGLYNRNRYQQDLPLLAKEGQKELCCIFVDVNGLHELNNTQGHQAGDQMLQAVAAQIRQHFDPKWAYRVGGDEFVIFTVDQDRTEVLRLSRAMADALQQAGYYISAGVAWAKAPAGDLQPLLKAAEKQMYELKRAFYQDPAHNRRAR